MTDEMEPMTREEAADRIREILGWKLSDKASDDMRRFHWQAQKVAAELDRRIRAPVAAGEVEEMVRALTLPTQWISSTKCAVDGTWVSIDPDDTPTRAADLLRRLSLRVTEVEAHAVELNRALVIAQSHNATADQRIADADAQTARFLDRATKAEAALTQSQAALETARDEIERLKSIGGELLSAALATKDTTHDNAG